MSTSIWVIKGLGFNIKDLKFNYEAILNRNNINWDKEAIDAGAFTLEEYAKHIEGIPNSVTEYIQSKAKELMKIAFENSTIGHLFGYNIALDYSIDTFDTEYLLYPALMPWQMDDSVVKMSREDMETTIIKMIQPFTTQSTDELAKLIGDIHSYCRE